MPSWPGFPKKKSLLYAWGVWDHHGRYLGQEGRHLGNIFVSFKGFVGRRQMTDKQRFEFAAALKKAGFMDLTTGPGALEDYGDHINYTTITTDPPRDVSAAPHRGDESHRPEAIDLQRLTNPSWPGFPKKKYPASIGPLVLWRLFSDSWTALRDLHLPTHPSYQTIETVLASEYDGNRPKSIIFLDPGASLDEISKVKIVWWDGTEQFLVREALGKDVAPGFQRRPNPSWPGFPKKSPRSMEFYLYTPLQEDRDAGKILDPRSALYCRRISISIDDPAPIITKIREALVREGLVTRKESQFLGIDVSSLTGGGYISKVHDFGAPGRKWRWIYTLRTTPQPYPP